MKKGLLALLLLICSFFSVNAATYYSYNAGGAGSYTFNTLSNWNTNRAGGGSNPGNFTTANDIFVVQNGYTMTVTGASITFAAGAKLQIESGGNVISTNQIGFNATATFQIDNGGTYTHNNTSSWTNTLAGIESFGASSNVIIQATSTTGPGTPTTGWGNLSYTAIANMNMSGALTDASSSSGKSIQGNLSVSGNSMRLSGATACTVTVGGNVTVSGSGMLALCTSSGLVTMNVNGNVNVTGGNLNVQLGNDNTNVKTLNISGNLTISSGTFEYQTTGTSCNGV
ncbi:MAG: hypothetical protein ACOVOV_13670, partial [Dolichospermum sp.]